MNDGQSGMHVGVQGIGTSKVELEFLVRHGVTHMDASVENNEVETLVRHKEEAAEYGVSLESIHIGVPPSITLAQDPQRDRDLDEVCRWIENGGESRAAGVALQLLHPAASAHRAYAWARGRDVQLI